MGRISSVSNRSSYASKSSRASTSSRTSTPTRTTASSSRTSTSTRTTVSNKKTSNHISTSNQQTVSTAVKSVKSYTQKVSTSSAKNSSSTGKVSVSTPGYTKKTKNQTTIRNTTKTSLSSQQIKNNTNKSWNYATDGSNYGKVLYAEGNGPSASWRSGVTICNVEAGVTKVGGNYSNLNWNFGVATADARAGIEYNTVGSGSIDKRGNTQGTKGFGMSYVGFNADASLLRADATAKIPIPFTNKSLSIGVNGKGDPIKFRVNDKQ